jgi:hypothetical protein
VAQCNQLIHEIDKINTSPMEDKASCVLEPSGKFSMALTYQKLCCRGGGGRDYIFAGDILEVKLPLKVSIFT